MIATLLTKLLFMAIVKLEEVIAYSDDEKVYCPECVDDTAGLEPIFRDPNDDEVVFCDICGKIQ